MQDEQLKEKPGADHNMVVQRSVPIQDRPKTGKNGKELKRKRFNPLILPSLFEDIKKIAYVEKSSINEIFNRALESYRDARKDILAKYAEIEKLKAGNGDIKATQP
jgi:hypothetical protein